MIPSIMGYGGTCCTNVQTVFQKFIEDTLEQKFPDYYLYTSFHYVAQWADHQQKLMLGKHNLIYILKPNITQTVEQKRFIQKLIYDS